MEMNHKQRTLFAKYTQAMIDVTVDGRIEVQTAQLVLVLAMRDMADAIPKAPTPESEIELHTYIVRQVEALVAQHAPGIYDRLISGEFTTVAQALEVLMHDWSEDPAACRRELIAGNGKSKPAADLVRQLDGEVLP